MRACTVTRLSAIAAVALVVLPDSAHAVLCSGAMSLDERLTCVLEEQLLPLLGDLVIILEEGPKYLAQRLPAVQAMGDLGADMDLPEPWDFSVSLGLGSGILRGFNEEVASGFQRLPKNLPDPLPMPAVLLSARVAVHRDWEVTTRFGYVPAFEVESRDWLVSATTRNLAIGTRYRLLAGGGGVPNLVTSAEISYFSGHMKVGRDFTYDLIGLRDAAEAAGYAWEPFRTAINDEYREKAGGEDLLGADEDLIIGTLFRGAPILGWDIVQLSVEQRATWAVGFWHPVLGLGLDAARGEVDSGIQMAVDLRVTKPRDFIDVAGNQRTVVLPDQNITTHTESPRPFGARAIAGMEFDLGDLFRLPIEGQYDLTSGTFSAALALRLAWK